MRYLFYFHGKEKIFDKIWHIGINLHQAHVSLHRWYKTIHVVRQELQPVCPPSGCGLDCIIFEDVKVGTTLNTKIRQLCYCAVNPKLTVFFEEAGRGYTTRLNWNSNEGTLTVGKSIILQNGESGTNNDSFKKQFYIKKY